MVSVLLALALVLVPQAAASATGPSNAPDLVAILQADAARLPVSVDEVAAAGRYILVDADTLPSDALLAARNIDVIQPSPASILSFEDPMYGDQWALSRFAASVLLERGQNGDGVAVAVVDTGYSAPALDGASSVLAGWSFVSSTANTTDDNGHGTSVASLIAAPVNAQGMQGLAPAVDLMPVKVLDSLGRGSSATIALGIRYAADNGADVINVSAGSSGDPGGLYADAIAYAASKGAVTVCAAGNDGTTAMKYPARIPGCIAVGAIKATNQRAGFSSYGPELDLVAPGQGLVVPQLAGGYAMNGQGTSFAAPYVSASAALLVAHGVAAQDVAEALTASAQDVGAQGRDDETGHGLVSALNVLGPEIGVADSCSNLTGVQVNVPAGYSQAGGICTQSDACSNIAGIQASPPDYHLTDTVTGSCFLDSCINLDGLQISVPEFHSFQQHASRPAGQGYCWPVDQCINVAGVQPVVPEHYTQDGMTCYLDVCTNLSGIQEVVPDGYRVEQDPLRPEGSGECIPVDECDNIAGQQLVVPDYHARDGDSCYLDACSNLVGWQVSAPTNFVFEQAVGGPVGAGTCAEIDVCSNLAGAQHTVPGGYEQADGDCTLIDDDGGGAGDGDRDDPSPPDPCAGLVGAMTCHLDVCPNVEGLQLIVPSGQVLQGGQCVAQGGNGGGGSGGSSPVDPVRDPQAGADVCANVAGAQAQVPSGWRVAGANCLQVITLARPTIKCSIKRGKRSCTVTSKIEPLAGGGKAVVKFQRRVGARRKAKWASAGTCALTANGKAASCSRVVARGLYRVQVTVAKTGLRDAAASAYVQRAA